MKDDTEKEECTEEGGINMAVLAKPINKVSVIQERDSRKFVQDFNNNRVSKEFLDVCKKAGSLFGKHK